MINSQIMDDHCLTSSELDLNADLSVADIAASPLHNDAQIEPINVELSSQPSTSSSAPNNATPKIIYLDRVCRTCLAEKEKHQLKDLFEFCLAETVMACVNITIEESDGLPCHICMSCLQEVEKIFNFRQLCERSDVTIRSLIEKSVVINQDSHTKYEVLNVVLTDSNGNTETSSVVVPIEELRFQVVNSSSNNIEVATETINIPMIELNKTVELPTLSDAEQSDKLDLGPIDVNFPTTDQLLVSEDTLVQNEPEEDPIITVDPNELLNETVPTSPNDFTVEETKQAESTILETLKQELSEFISNTDLKKGDLDDNDDDEMIHVDYLKDALTEEYIQIMEKQLAPTVPRTDSVLQDRLEQENLDGLINDEDDITVKPYGEWSSELVQVAEEQDDISAQTSDDDGGRHCKTCDLEFEDNRQYKRHMKKHSEKRFDCSHCSRKFAEQSLLKNHMLRHTGEKAHACNVCSARFYEKNMLNVHMRRHSNVRPYGCDTCGKRFTTKSLLNTHNKIHLGEKSHICNVCGKGFTLSWQLKAHARIHTNEKPFECPYCQKRFNQNGNLMIHIRIHTGEKPFQCTLCEKAYPSQGELGGHMRQHTGEKKTKKITCTVCQKAFAGNGDLKIHMRTHTKEKPYTCQMCGKSFMLHVHLTVHMRTHTGEKPFACNLCEKAFATNYQLKNHTYVHTGEKNYACDICNRRFSSSANRNTHRKTHDRKVS